MVLRLVPAVDPILQQVERHAKAFETQLGGETQLLEAEIVDAEIDGVVAFDELIAAVAEGALAVGACCFAEGRPLKCV